MGKGPPGYVEALDLLLDRLGAPPPALPPT